MGGIGKVLGVFVAPLRAQRLDGLMDEPADVSRAEAGRCADFLVGKAGLKFQLDDFALFFGQVCDQPPNAGRGIFRVEFVVRTARGGWLVFHDFGFHGNEAFGFAVKVDDAVAAYGEEPRREAFDVSRPSARRRLRAEFDKGVLHRIAGLLEIAAQGERIANERFFEAGERGQQPGVRLVLGG